MQSKQVIALIEEAFASVELGNAGTIHQADLVGKHGMSKDFSKEEYEKARYLDPETDWRHVSDKTLDECEGGPFFLMEHESWRFYLPAYMVSCTKTLADLNGESDLKLILTIFYLDYSRHTTVEGKILALGYFEMLNEMQVQSVAAFLRYVRDNMPNGIGKNDIGKKYNTRFSQPEQALASYWELPRDARPTKSILSK